MAAIAVTGANGFIGRQLVDRLRRAHAVRRIVREQRGLQGKEVEDTVAVGSIGATTAWSNALDGVDVVIHLAAIAHRPVPAPDVLEDVNVHGVRRLAEHAARAGVRRVVFLSTIGVHGNATGASPFTENSPLHPHDDYARSKARAEEALTTVVSTKQDMDYVIIRPPMVYGSGAPGNFGRLVRLVRRGVPLPLGAIENRRSMISVMNLCDFLAQAAVDERAANEVFVISDGEDISTPDLVRCLAGAMQLRPRLLHVPLWLLKAGLAAASRSKDFSRLYASLEVDSSRSRSLLDWEPPLTLHEGLKQSVAERYES